MNQHAMYKFSVTVHTDDLALLHCLRGLSQFSQKKGNVRIPWGGTKKTDWKMANHKATFHFSSPAYRKCFIQEATRLVPDSLWKEVSRSDHDPAKPITQEQARSSKRVDIL